MLSEHPGRNSRRSSPLSVAVLCSSDPGRPSVVSVARDVGRLLGEGAHQLVYGGSSAGLMGEVARTAHVGGSQIFAAIPLSLYERERNDSGLSQVVRITTTVCQRKDAMFAMADAFIALPGGLDTVDEVLDVITLSRLRLNNKPLALIQTCGEWQPLLDLLDRIAEYRFADPPASTLLRVVSSAAEALDFIKRLPPSPEARVGTGQTE
jgi:uncharacterized protein (TIGR00730 family)